MQACQGDKLDSGVVMSKTETDGHLDINSYRIPAQADFLVVYSTVKGNGTAICFTTESRYLWLKIT
jgi:hypothetical protein